LRSVYFVLVISLVLSACTGRSGADGNVYLSINWQDMPKSYNDNNAGIPFGFEQGLFYKCQPGRYNFEYTATNDFVYNGKYKLEAAQGEDGQVLWKDGENGPDTFYTLWLNQDGPQFYKGESAIPLHRASIKSTDQTLPKLPVISILKHSNQR